MKTRIHLIALLFAVTWIAGCGAPGAPLPPSLELSRPVEDLTVTRKGNKVYLSWSAPTQTTDGQNVRARKLGPAQVCRAIATFPMTSCVQVAGEIPAAQVPTAPPSERVQRLTFTDTLNEQVEREHPAQFATYAVSMLNSRGRTAGLSNQIRVPLAYVLPAPHAVLARVGPDAISLSVTGEYVVGESGLAHALRFYRRTEGSNAAVIVEEAPSHLHTTVMDSAFEWEKTYYYHVTPVTIVTQNGKKIAEVEGDDSPEVKVFAHDVFPPEQPSGLEAVFSGVGQKLFIDVTWAPNTDADLAGYDIYRHEQGQGPVKINTALIKTPSYRDEHVQPGHTYFYFVRAVDLRGNESVRSEETSERVP